MAATKVTQPRLADAAKTATDTGESITINLTRVLNAIEESHASFRGGAGDMFQGKSQELGGELRKLLDALNGMANAVDSSASLYGSTDADAANEINKVTNTYMPGAGDVANQLRG
ncbi:MAG: WXG100 family type VII secretion target [Actinocatenispora sp.]